MPARVLMSTYVKMLAASLLAMCVGAEVVHRYYRPDLTIPEIPPKKHKPQVSQQEELK
uniref:Protein BRAWNIN n=1 Tax=Saimiri boliviensis boliviensis TaxID=39432 RepID=A0A2K6TSF0_SAIBB